MRLTLILVLINLMSLHAVSYTQSTLNINLKNASLKQVLSQIESQSDYRFLYNDKAVENVYASVEIENSSIDNVLSEVLTNTGNSYQLMDNNLIIIAPEKILEKGKQSTISGTVVDADGFPVPGVNILEKGTSNGAITDFDGNFKITVTSENPVLVFSFIGYKKQEIVVSGKTQLNVTLEADVTGLDEVVVVGYGTVKKSDVTGSLSSVTSEEINEMPTYNVNQAMQGRAAGVDIVNTGFSASSAPMVRIRGSRSVKATNDPMYIIDGVPVEAGIGEVNPMDIESIEVLKDASATAIYGSRAANGVIIITTKRGKAGRMTVNYEGSIGFETPLVKYDLASGGEWMEVFRANKRTLGSYTPMYADPTIDERQLSRFDEVCWESVKMGYEWDDNGDVVMRDATDDENERWGVDQIPVYDPSKVRTYDWEDEALQIGVTHNHQFSVSGGSEKLTAFFSVGYINREGISIGQKYQRVSPRLNLDFQATKWLKVGVSNSFSYTLNDPGHGIYGKVAGMIPITLPYDTTGNFIMLPFNSDIENPLRDDELNTTEDRISRYLGSYYAEIKFFDGLRYRVNVGQDVKYRGYGQFQDENSTDRYGNPNWARYREWHNLNWTVENLLFFNKKFGVHNIGITLLQSAGAQRYEYKIMSGEGYAYTKYLWHSLGSASDPEDLSVDSDYSRQQIASFMGRINYSLLDRYLLTATLRYDGTSKFYDDPDELLENNWDYFPSFAFAWKINEEVFMQNVSAIDQLKLRVGYGTTGQSSTDPYETNGQLVESYYVYGDDAAKGYAPELIATKDVGWEKTTSLNVGLDFSVFQNRITGSIDVYNNKTTDLLLDMAVPSVTGYSTVRANIGKMENKGFEITLSTINIDHSSGFKWETDFVFSKNKEELVELYGNNEDDLVNGWFLGEPVTSFYTYAYDGIWQIKDSVEMAAFNESSGTTFKAGKIKVKDIDGDGEIDEDDKTVVGNSVPDFTGGITNRFSYKGFTLSAFVYFRVGQGIYNRDTHSPLYDGLSNVLFDVHYYAPSATEEENASATHPAPNTARDPYYEALMYQEASFVKIKHITLEYNFPQFLLNKIKLKSLRIYAMATNPFLFTDYPYLDPEAQGTFDSDTNKFNDKYVPSGISQKGIVFGVRLGL